MKFELALAGLITAAVTLPAMAQTSYYVVQDTMTKKCTIMDQRPTVSEETVVGPDRVVYKNPH